MSGTRSVVAAMALATALALAPISVAGATPARVTDASIESAAGSLTNASCRSALPAIRSFSVDLSRLSDGVVRLGTWTVDFERNRWRAEHPRVQLLTRAFHSSAWLIPDDIDDLPRSVALFVEQARINPDPTDWMTARQLRERGWVEGHTTWRLKTALCLYRISTPDLRDDLMPAIDQLLQANLDPERYYGPPFNPAHNHGLMADRELLNAARILNRPDLAERAIVRLQMQKGEMYDSCGLNFEQASSYQFLHASLWQQLLRRIDDPRLAQRIESTVEMIGAASAGLAFPDGSVPSIGDGSTRNVDDLSLVNTPLVMWCPETGWSSRRTDKAGFTQQLITRFGPATDLHGHSDKGSFVWWVGSGSTGVPVIADRGTPPKTKANLVAQARSAASHSVFDWRRVSDQRSTAITRRENAREVISITSANQAWTRQITFTPSQLVLRVQDSVNTTTPAGSARSYLPLDPIWQRTADPRTFRTDAGWTLTITCTDAAKSRILMRTQQVEDFQQGESRAALRVTCQVAGARNGINAVLRVTPPSQG